MKIGILGGGQLAQMLALAAYPLGLEVICFNDQVDCPAAKLAKVATGTYQDVQALQQFCQQIDVLTYESENIPWELVTKAELPSLVYPPPAALQVAQDRAKEKALFCELGFATPAFAVIESLSQLEQAITQIGLPAVLKTTRFGYDGKGQIIIRQAQQCAAAFAQLGGQRLILEQFIPFEREVSLISVRSHDNHIKHYPLVDNQHKEGILQLSQAPFMNELLQQQAQSMAEKLLQHVDYVGVLAIEFFVVGSQLLLNEIAPRVHNSGHWTIEGAATSQFENHCRAICHLPLGSTQAIGLSAMFNCVGQEPALATILAIPDVHYHCYGKEPRSKRKLAHATLHSFSQDDYRQRLALLQREIPFE